MGMTLSQKILASHVCDSHCGKDKLEAGQLVLCNLDRVHGNDVTCPPAIREFNKMGLENVFDKDKVTMVMDHFVPNKDIKAAEQCKICRDFCNEHAMDDFYDVGKMGIEHALLPESGLVVSGDVTIGADSHTCTYGALGAFSTGVGSTDMAFGMATGKAWFKVPSAIKFELSGKLNPHVSGKDVILHIIGMIGVDGALYRSMEFTGEGAHNLSMSDRFTICNMAIEAGAKNGIFEVDDKTLEYEGVHAQREPKIFHADPDAEYDEVIKIDLSTIKPTVAFPHLPENTHTVDEIGEVKIDQVVIGSCTNGLYDDIKVAWEIIKGHKVAEGLRVIIIPATQKVYLRCLEEGFIKDFIEAGCIVSTPTCGPCLGGYMGVLAHGERCVSTTNRNFVGRMGDPTSEVYLASPATAAASALTGKITDPREATI
ncbi:MAG: 3-isopropylmalate dehydratase large subunit [Oscillospiraceae bacterium]|nr:3-isopropylmalate dehydratase large subunit [Oscillospiraceae bacterium]